MCGLYVQDSIASVFCNKDIKIKIVYDTRAYNYSIVLNYVKFDIFDV